MTEKKSFSYYIWLIGLTLSLFGISAIAVFTQSMPPSFQQSQSIRQTYDDLIPINAVYNYFASQVFLKRDKTVISFPFALTDEQQLLWLGYAPAEGVAQSEILVAHPQFNNLTWESLEIQPGVFLYQRNPTYSNSEEFLSNPPEIDSIRVDKLIKPDFPQFEQAGITDLPFELSGVDYLLTTYRHHEYEDGVFYAEIMVDATDAKIEQNNSIQWFIRAPGLDGVEEEGYLIGSIGVNYVQ